MTEIKCIILDAPGVNMDIKMERNRTEKLIKTPTRAGQYSSRSRVCWLGGLYEGCQGGGPGAVVKTACLQSRKSRVRTPFWPSSFKETKCFFHAHS